MKLFEFPFCFSIEKEVTMARSAAVSSNGNGHATKNRIKDLVSPGQTYDPAEDENVSPVTTKKKAKKAESKPTEFHVTPPKWETVTFKVVGVDPMVWNKFSKRQKDLYRKTQEGGGQNKKGKKKEPKNFKQCFEDAKHVSKQGWEGIPCTAFRNALVSACVLVDFFKTIAKKCIKVEADGFERDDGTPLVRITKGKPSYAEHVVRNASGVIDLRARPLWEPGWEAIIRISYDADRFTAQDICNLLMRAGAQIGIGEGRMDSKNSCGMGWGCFEVRGSVQPTKKKAKKG